MRQILVSLAFAALILTAHAAPEATAPQPKSRTISVSGCAVGFIQPDAVLWTVTRECSGKSIAEAKDSCEQQIKILLDGLAKKGIQSGDLSLGIAKIQDALSGQEAATVEATKRFTVSRSLTFRQRELHMFQDVLDLLGKGAGKVTYKMYCARIDAITRETLVRATQAAKEKAAAMAGVLGASLGPVQSISEYAPTNVSVKEENVVIDSNTPVFGSEAQKIVITVFATFELQ